MSKYTMEPVSEIERWNGKRTFETFAAHCLWRLRYIGRHQSKMMDKQLAATNETNSLLRKMAGDKEPVLVKDDQNILEKAVDIAKDLANDGKRNHSHKKKGK